MTTLPNLITAADDAEDGELLYVVSPAGPRKRSFLSLWRNVLGRTASTPRGFFGAVPLTQPSGANQATVPGTPISATAGGSYTTAECDLINDIKAQVNALTVLCNAQRAALVALGLMKGSAWRAWIWISGRAACRGPLNRAVNMVHEQWV